jgi:hypothetical protein
MGRDETRCCCVCTALARESPLAVGFAAAQAAHRACSSRIVIASEALARELDPGRDRAFEPAAHPPPTAAGRPRCFAYAVGTASQVGSSRASVASGSEP